MPRQMRSASNVPEAARTGVALDARPVSDQVRLIGGLVLLHLLGGGPALGAGIAPDVAAAHVVPPGIVEAAVPMVPGAQLRLQLPDGVGIKEGGTEKVLDIGL